MNIKKLGKLAWPYLVWMLILVGLPLMLMILLSVMTTQRYSFIGGLFSLDHWIRLVQDSSVSPAFGFSFMYSIAATIISFFIGYPMAYIVARSTFSNKMVILVLSIIPMWANSLLRNNAIANLLSSNSILNDLLGENGLSLLWPIKESDAILFDTIFGAVREYDIAVVIGLVLTYLPFMILPIYTVLEKMDESLLEAAMDLGAGRIRTFFKVTFPLSMKGVMTGIIMVFLPCFSGFAIQQILSNGNRVVVGTLIQEYFRGDPNFTSVLSIVMLIIIFGSMLVVSKVDKEGETLI